MEGYPTYVIAKDPGAPATHKLKAALIEKVPYVVEIRDFPHQRRFEHKFIRRGDRLHVYPSF
jgi:hypothetical protein